MPGQLATILAVGLGIFLTATAITAHAELVTLTADQFDTQISSGRWMVKFYVPWCGHCRQFASTYQKVGELDFGESVNVAELNCEMSESVCKRLGIKGFPEVRVFENGNEYFYEGARDVSRLADFLSEGYLTVAPKKAVTGPEYAALEQEKAKKMKALLDASKVVKLSSENFDDYVLRDGAGPYLVNFFQSPCHSCNKLNISLIQLSIQLYESNSDTNIAEVDCSGNMRLCYRLRALRSPQLVYFREQSMRHLSGADSRTPLDRLAKVVNGAWKDSTPTPVPEKDYVAPFDRIGLFMHEHTILGVGILISILGTITICLGRLVLSVPVVEDGEGEVEGPDASKAGKTVVEKKND